MIEERKLLTLAIPLEVGKVLLGMKKRGFGDGKWNGFGGKVHQDETIEEAAARETFEECEIEILKMEKVGIHEFSFTDKPGEILEVHVFRVDEFRGEPQETEEMAPAWFSTSDIPYESMWSDDEYWFPLFLAGKKFRGEFLFTSDGEIVTAALKEVESV
ncbi:MAG: 8-oxo-dGTP diphosphatase [Candidatus Moraniibacteriota bacterium]